MKRRMMSGVAALLMAVPVLSLAEDTMWSFTLCGSPYTLPVTMEALMADGWETEQAEDALSPDSYTVDEMFTREGMSFHGSVINLSINELKEAECFLGQVTVTREDAQTGVTLVARGGVTLGSTRDEVLEAWGDPDSIEQDGDHCTLSYGGEGYDKAEFTFDGDAVTAVSLRCFTVPAGYLDDARVVDTLPPEDQYEYQAPLGLGDALQPGLVSLQGVAYQLPVPFAVLAGAGWRCDQEDAVVPSRDTLWDAALSGGRGRGLTAALTNASPVATVASNCLVTGLTAVDDSLTLPGGLSVGTSAEDVETALSGLPYDAEESDGMLVYRVDFGMGQDIALSVDTGTGEVCRVDVVAMPGV